MSVKIPPPETPVDAECKHCTHSPAYHDGDGGRPCRAWNPDLPDHVCCCPGWAPKPPPAPPAPAAEEPEAMPWL